MSTPQDKDYPLSTRLPPTTTNSHMRIAQVSTHSSACGALPGPPRAFGKVGLKPHTQSVETLQQIKYLLQQNDVVVGEVELLWRQHRADSRWVGLVPAPDAICFCCCFLPLSPTPNDRFAKPPQSLRLGSSGNPSGSRRCNFLKPTRRPVWIRALRNRVPRIRAIRHNA